jgi:hypothetical protein
VGSIRAYPQVYSIRVCVPDLTVDEHRRFAPIRKSLLYRAAEDFFWLQNRRYPRKTCLELVGNRYQLHRLERQFLHRGVFSQWQLLSRHAKRCLGEAWQSENLVVDGHNVQITVESGILGRPLLLANDGVVRDLAGQSARYKLSEVSELALEAILQCLSESRPREVLFLFDAPMHHSGLLASRYRRRIKALGLCGEARTAPVPEREFPYAESVVASSDQAVLDAATHWLDLARRVLERSGLAYPVMDFSALVLTATGRRNVLPAYFQTEFSD